MVSAVVAQIVESLVDSSNSGIHGESMIAQVVKYFVSQ